MKALLIVLGIVLAYQSTTILKENPQNRTIFLQFAELQYGYGPKENTWVQVDIGQAQTNSSIRNLLQFGIDESMNNIYWARELVVADSFQLVKIKSVLKQTIGYLNFLRFDLELTDNKDTMIALTCNVAVDTPTLEILFEGYELATVSLYTLVPQLVNSNQGYSQVDQTEMDTNPVIQRCLNFGIHRLSTLLPKKERLLALLSSSQELSVVIEPFQASSLSTSLKWSLRMMQVWL